MGIELGYLSAEGLLEEVPRIDHIYIIYIIHTIYITSMSTCQYA